MSLPAEFLDDLRARIGLFSLVGRRVKLVRAGREMKGCCPFHNEKTPSFYVNEDKGFYHCFGCGAHGDAIGFVMAQDGLNFIEAVKSLAAEAGLAMPEERQPDPETRRRAGLQDLLEAAADWYRTQLAGVSGADARAYLERRQVSTDVAARFGLGLAPDSRDALSRAMMAKFPGLEPAQMLDAGLAGESEGRRYDRFRGRLMFPIHDRRGRVVGFGGRTLGDVEPKYLNSAEGPVFHKGRLLYNLHRAAPAARKSGRLLVVEGYMDVVGLAQAGFEEAVAPLGTALTEEQLELAWRLVPEPLLAFDGDAAGMRAGLRAAHRALALLKPGRSLGFLALPPGQDPDDIARNGGHAAIEALLATARPLDRFLFDAEAGAAPLDTPERRGALKARLKALAADIADQDLRRDYLSTWLDRADALFRAARPQRGGGPATGARTGRGQDYRQDYRRGQPLPPPGALAETRAMANTPSEAGIAGILASLAARPEALAHHAEALAHLNLRTEALALARDALLHGRDPGDVLAGVTPRFPADMDETEFDAAIGSALATLAQLHHIGSEKQQPGDLSSDEAFARAFERRRLLAEEREDARRRLTALAIGSDPA